MKPMSRPFASSKKISGEASPPTRRLSAGENLVEESGVRDNETASAMYRRTRVGIWGLEKPGRS